MSNITNRINNSPFNDIPRKDKRHMMIILAILGTLILVDVCINALRGNGAKAREFIENDSTARQRISELTLAYNDSLLDDSTATISDINEQPSSLFPFDPNTADMETLKKLGLSERQASTLIKYREKGGRFRNAEDFAKLRGVSPEQISRLMPYIAIIMEPTSTGIGYNEPAENQAKNQETKKSMSYFTFDPNGISQEDFVKLGFTENQAATFIKYRGKGKKFYVAKDFRDVSFVDDKVFQSIAGYIDINLDSLTDHGRLRDLNTIDKAGLMECGLKEQEADKVLTFREMIGAYYAPWQICDCIDRNRGNKLKSSFYVCGSVSRKMIDIRTAGKEELTANPYISELQAIEIISHQADAEPMTASRIAQLGIFDGSEMKRVANYLIWEK